jgi:hypothetical protein
MAINIWKLTLVDGAAKVRNPEGFSMGVAA